MIAPRAALARDKVPIAALPNALTRIMATGASTVAAHGALTVYSCRKGWVRSEETRVLMARPVLAV